MKKNAFSPEAIVHVAHAYQSHNKTSRFLYACKVEEFSHAGAICMVRPRAHNKLIDWPEYRVNMHQPGVFWLRHSIKPLGGTTTRILTRSTAIFMKAITQGFRITANPSLLANRIRRLPSSKTEFIGEIN